MTGVTKRTYLKYQQYDTITSTHTVAHEAQKRSCKVYRITDRNNKYKCICGDKKVKRFQSTTKYTTTEYRTMKWY